MVLGEYGLNKNAIAQCLANELDDFESAIASYKGSLKRFFTEVAEQLDIPTTEPKLNADGEEIGEKALTADGLKDAIAGSINDKTLLIIPEAQRLPSSVRYWLEGLLEEGLKLILFAIANPEKDVFLSLLEVQLVLPGNDEIRKVMESEAKSLGLKLSASRLAELQPLAGNNPMLARKVIRAEKLGLAQTPQHRQYVVVMPIIMAALFSFAVIRYVGMGTGNKDWQIIGGVALTVAMAMKQIGNVRGPRKRLGQ